MPTPDIATTIDQLLTAFNEKSLPHAVLRNYQDLPSIGHDLDLIIVDTDVHKIRPILVNIAKTNSWDYLTELTTFNSKTRNLNIFVFQLYHLESL